MHRPIYTHASYILSDFSHENLIFTVFSYVSHVGFEFEIVKWTIAIDKKLSLQIFEIPAFSLKVYHLNSKNLTNYIDKVTCYYIYLKIPR